MNQYARTEMLLGEEGLRRLREARVAVFGVGGVGGYAAEALARSGVGTLDLFDRDCVSLTNLNRQILALHSTLDRPKVEVLAERIRDIDPTIDVRPHRMFYLPETADEVDLSAYSYVVDAVDTMAAKLELARRAIALRVPIISAMGAGNKLDPTCLRVADIEKTSVDPLARVMRLECRRRGIRGLKVVYSTEPPLRPAAQTGNAEAEETVRRATPGSTAFVPGTMGLIIAGVVVRELAAGAETAPVRA